MMDGIPNTFFAVLSIMGANTKVDLTKRQPKSSSRQSCKRTTDRVKKTGLATFPRPSFTNYPELLLTV